MNTHTDDLGQFEQRLLTELRAEITAAPLAAPARPRVRRRYLLAGAAAAAIAAGIAIPTLIGHGSSQAAYAVDTTSDGRIRVTINRIDDAAGLESGLEAKGVNAVVDYTPEGKVCQHPRFSPAPASRSVLGLIEVGAGNGAPHTLSFDLNPADYTGFTIVIELSGQQGSAPTLDGPDKFIIGKADGPVAPCVLTDAPSS